jgi:hypothetical protein
VSIALTALCPAAVLTAIALTAHTLFFDGPRHVAATIGVLVGGFVCYGVGLPVAYAGVLGQPKGGGAAGSSD